MVVRDEKVEIFRQHRTRLFGIAYRMLGTRDDAEDILQEAYLRWHQAGAEEDRNARSVAGNGRHAALD